MTLMRTTLLSIAAVMGLTAAAPGTTTPGEQRFPNSHTITLSAENGNTFPGEALFEVKPDGVTVLVRARVVKNRSMPAAIDRGRCGSPGTRERVLSPVREGMSTTMLRGVKLTALEDGNHSLRVYDPANHGVEALCGDVRKPGIFSK